MRLPAANNRYLPFAMLNMDSLPHYPETGTLVDKSILKEIFRHLWNSNRKGRYHLLKKIHIVLRKIYNLIRNDVFSEVIAGFLMILIIDSGMWKRASNDFPAAGKVI